MTGVLNQSNRIGLVAIVVLWLIWLIPQFMGDYRVYRNIEQPSPDATPISKPISQVTDLAPIVLGDLYLMGKPRKTNIEPIKKFENLEVNPSYFDGYF